MDSVRDRVFNIFFKYYYIATWAATCHLQRSCDSHLLLLVRCLGVDRGSQMPRGEVQSCVVTVNVRPDSQCSCNKSSTGWRFHERERERGRERERERDRQTDRQTESERDRRDTERDEEDINFILRGWYRRLEVFLHPALA